MAHNTVNGTNVTELNMSARLKWQLLCYIYFKAEVAQLRPTLWDPMGYTGHGILQARILEWVAMPFPRGSSQPRDQTQVSHTAGRFFTIWATREAQYTFYLSLKTKKQNTGRRKENRKLQQRESWLLCPNPNIHMTQGHDLKPKPTSTNKQADEQKHLGIKTPDLYSPKNQVGI